VQIHATCMRTDRKFHTHVRVLIVAKIKEYLGLDDLKGSIVNTLLDCQPTNLAERKSSAENPPGRATIRK